MYQLPDNVRKVAVYLRRSREDMEAEKRGEDTLLAQRDLMTNHVLPRFECAYDIFAEVESGDTIKDRPVFQQVLTALGSSYQAIAVKDLSRLGRGNYGDMGRVYDVIRDNDIYVITRDSVFDPHNEDHKRAIRMAMFINREEYESIVLRLTNGKYDKTRDRGFWVAGSTPYGYEYDRNTRKLRPNEHATIVRLIYHLYVNEGFSYRKISTHLERAGIKTATGKDFWNPQVIRRLLMNPAYAGDIQFRRTKRRKADGKVTHRPEPEHIWYRNAHEAIVGRETWNRAQDRVRRLLPKTPQDYSPCELAGLVTCADCGRKMIRQTTTQRYHKRNSPEVSVYQREFLVCLACGYYIGYRHVETQMLAVLRAFLVNTDTLEQAVHKYQQDNLNSEYSFDSIEQARRDLDSVESSLENSALAYLTGTFSKRVYVGVQRRLEADRAAIEARLSYLEQQQIEKSETSEIHDPQNIPNTITTLAEAYHHLTHKSRKNRLLQGLFGRVELEFLGKQGRRNGFNLHIHLAETIFRNFYEQF